MHIRAGEFPKKIYAPGPKAGFWSKKCPQKAGEPYAQFSPSEIWVIVLTQILINVVTIAQISEGEIGRRAPPLFGGIFWTKNPLLGQVHKIFLEIHPP